MHSQLWHTNRCLLGSSDEMYAICKGQASLSTDHEQLKKLFIFVDGVLCTHTVVDTM
jgi:hypothetical protein